MVGIEIYGGTPTVEHNLIINNLGSETVGGGGIRIDYAGTNPTISNNTIMQNSAGFNLINSPSPKIQNNNIQNNFDYNIYLYSYPTPTTNNINVANNWWGTTDTQAINQTIYDFKDDFNLGNVSFVHFLGSPNIQAPTYINAISSDGGTIAPSGIISLNYGESQAFTITPNTGYYLENVLLNGTSVGGISSYTVQNVNGATTIYAIFAPNPAPTPSPPPTVTPSPTPQTATVTILNSTGGSTNPSAGTYTYYANPVFLTLTATPSGDYNFVTWFIVTSLGSNSSYTDNPHVLTVTRGINYSVQALFSPISTPTPSPSPSPSPTPTETPSLTPAPTPIVVPTITPSPTPTPTISPSPTPQPRNQSSLDLSCLGSTSYSNFNVEITGRLTADGSVIPNSPVLLSNSVNNGISWIDLTTVYTDGSGLFSASWTPQVSGYYLMQAVYGGSSVYSNVSNYDAWHRYI